MNFDRKNNKPILIEQEYLNQLLEIKKNSEIKQEPSYGQKVWIECKDYIDKVYEHHKYKIWIIIGLFIYLIYRFINHKFFNKYEMFNDKEIKKKKSKVKKLNGKMIDKILSVKQEKEDDNNETETRYNYDLVEPLDISICRNVMKLII